MGEQLLLQSSPSLYDRRRLHDYMINIYALCSDDGNNNPLIHVAFLSSGLEKKMGRGLSSIPSLSLGDENKHTIHFRHFSDLMAIHEESTEDRRSIQ